MHVHDIRNLFWYSEGPDQALSYRSNLHLLLQIRPDSFLVHSYLYSYLFVPCRPMDQTMPTALAGHPKLPSISPLRFTLPHKLWRNGLSRGLSKKEKMDRDSVAQNVCSRLMGYVSSSSGPGYVTVHSSRSIVMRLGVASAENLQQRISPRLRIITRSGVGYDSIDPQGCRDRDIVVTNLPGANAQVGLDRYTSL